MYIYFRRPNKTRSRDFNTYCVFRLLSSLSFFTIYLIVYVYPIPAKFEAKHSKNLI